VIFFKETKFRTLLLLSKKEDLINRFTETLKGIVKVCSVNRLCEGEESKYDFIFIESSYFHFENYKLNEEHVHSVLGQLKQHFPDSKVVVFAHKELIDELAMIVKFGANDYLTLPLVRAEFLLLNEEIKKMVLTEEGVDYLTGHFWDRSFISQITTKSMLMKDVFFKVRQVAPKKTNVLLTGETGVGKNVVSRLIHCHSDRRDKPFVSVHCGAIPESLLESELFGHERGAFTGAIKRKLGKFELANGGTIFLDEIGTMTKGAQVKLLQVLQDSTFQRVGGEVEIRLDIRVIAATNIDIAEHVKSGEFREDLFYRINVFPISIPPLRDRVEDLPSLLRIFLQRYNKLYGCSINGFSTDVLNYAKYYDWPGNIRELENFVERACIIEKSNVLTLSSFPDLIRKLNGKDHSRFGPNGNVFDGSGDKVLPLMSARQKVIDDFEKNYFEDRLSENNGKIKTISEVAGIGPRQTHKLLAKYDLHADEYRKK
jgi:DNA-binding NtrC family response regulator